MVLHAHILPAKYATEPPQFYSFPQYIFIPSYVLTLTSVCAIITCVNHLII